MNDTDWTGELLGIKCPASGGWISRLFLSRTTVPKDLIGCSISDPPKTLSSTENSILSPACLGLVDSIILEQADRRRVVASSDDSASTEIEISASLGVPPQLVMIFILVLYLDIQVL